jgi:hypothetical protein
MEHIWQWAWDRYGARYSWAAFAITIVLGAPNFLVWSSIVVALQKSDRYVEAAVVTVAAMVLLQYLIVLPGLGGLRIVERWAAGHQVDPARALDATYVYARGAAARAVEVTAVGTALLLAGVGEIAGASGSQLAEYAILGAVLGGIGQLVAVHSYVEGAMRPARMSIAGDTGIGDSLPRSRPTFAAWSNLSMLAVAFTTAIAAAMLAAVFASAVDTPVLAIVIACVLVIAFTPLTIGAIYAPSLRPIRDLAEGTERVAAGDYGQRLPVFRMMIWVRWRRRSTACRRVWLSDNGFTPRSGLMSTRLWLHGCFNRVMTFSPVSAVR